MKMRLCLCAKAYAGLIFLGLSGMAAAQAPISCMVVPWREAGLGVDIAGIVAERHVTRTQNVKAGEVLLELQSGLAQADLDRAQLSYDEVKARLQRSEGLSRNNVISRDEIEKLRVEHSLSEVELRAAGERLRKTQILAPFDGVITGVAVEPGELTGSAALMTLAEVARLKALMILPIEAWGQYKTGDMVEIGVELTGHKRAGKVISVDSFIDPSANSFRVEVGLENPNLDLPPGVACQKLG